MDFMFSIASLVTSGFFELFSQVLAVVFGALAQFFDSMAIIF